MTKPKVLLRFDIEDYITTKTNEALQAVLEILDEVEIQATFVLVGEKIRMLLNNGATTIIDLLQKHALGYHSYLHSFHPLANEYLQNKDWQSGINDFLGKEELGHRLFVETFDQPPICYTQPGADWVPQTYIALQQWEIPFFFTEEKNSLLTFAQQPFLVNGILTLANKPTINDLVNLGSSPGEQEKARNQFQTDYQQIIQNESIGLLVLTCHPGRFVTIGQETWDQLNFANGENRDRQNWSSPPLKSETDYQADLQAFKEFLLFLQDTYEFDWITAQDLVNIYQNRIIHKDRVVDTLTQKPYNFDNKKIVNFNEIKAIAKNFIHEISYFSLKNVILSPIQAVSVLCQFILIKHKEGYLASSISIPNEIFFPGKISTAKVDPNIKQLSWLELVRGAEQIITQIQNDASFPLKIKVGLDLWLELEQFTAGIAQAVSQIIDEQKQPKMIALSETYLKTKDNVKKINEVNWNWTIFRNGFQNVEILNYAELLGWTIKPLK